MTFYLTKCVTFVIITANHTKNHILINYMPTKLSGDIINKYYEIIRELGQGSFGVTYLVEDTRITDWFKGKLFVIKELKHQSNSPNVIQKAKELFEREAKVLLNLGNSPDNKNYIPKLLFNLEENGEFFLVQDFIDGKDLSAEIKDNKQHNQFYVINLLKSVLIILDFIHNNGVIHRDIKPSNLMRLKQNKKIMLIDFGAVKEISTLNNNTSATIIGTDGYRPREQEIGKPEFYSDIYALGMVAIYAMTGISPDLLPRDNNNNLIWRDRIPSNYVYNPDFLNIIDKMVKDDFSERYQSAKEVLTALNNLSIPVFERFKNFILSPIGLSSSGIVLIVIILIFWQPKPLESLKCKFQNYPYQNDFLNYNVNVCYPETWNQQNKIDIFGNVARFLPPTENNKQILENVELTVKQNQKLTLDEHGKNVIDNSQKDTNNKIISTTNITMANKEGRKVIYEILEDGKKFKRMEIFVFKDDQIYTLIYSAEPENFDKYLKEVYLMMNNLEILD